MIQWDDDSQTCTDVTELCELASLASCSEANGFHAVGQLLIAEQDRRYNFCTLYTIFTKCIPVLAAEDDVRNVTGIRSEFPF